MIACGVPKMDDVYRTDNKNRVVGLREVLASLKEDKISKIYLAQDSDAAYKERVLTAALEKNVQVEVCGTSAEFAKKCGLAHNRASVVGVLKN